MKWLRKKEDSLLKNRPNQDNNQYEKDFKQKHKYIDHLWYFDLDLDNYVVASLELFGHSYLFSFYEDTGRGSDTYGGKVKQKKGSFPINTRIEYQIIEDDGRLVTFRTSNGDLLRMGNRQYQTVREFFGQLNGDFEPYRLRILGWLSKLLSDADLIQMTNSYIADTQPIFFTDSHYIWTIEKAIKNRDSLGKLLLLWDDNYIKHMVAHHPGLGEGFSPYGDYDLTVKPYLEDSLYLFAKLIQDRLNLEGAEALYLTYTLLNRIAISYFSKKWEDEYHTYFPNINYMDLSQAVDQFCAVDSINKQDPISTGIFVYYLIEHHKFNVDNYLICEDIFHSCLQHSLGKQKYNNFIRRVKRSTTEAPYTINDIDLMDGSEFEKFVGLLFQKMGYETKVTKASQDQGIDVIASKNGAKIGIQAKCYSGSVGNSAIQEATAGKAFYNLDKVMVITNNYFTDAAQQLAIANSVVLWDRNILIEKLVEFM